MANHLSERAGARVFEVGLGVIGGIVGGVFGGPIAGVVGGGSLMLLGYALQRSKAAGRLTASEGVPDIEMSLPSGVQTAVEDGLSYGIPEKPGGSDYEFRIGLRSVDPGSAPLTRVVIEAVSNPWSGVVTERPLKLKNHEGPATTVPHSTGCPTVFAILAVQPGQFKDARFAYHDGEEITRPKSKKENRQTVLTIRATGESTQASYIKVRMDRTMGSLRWKLEDGNPVPPLSLAELVGEKNASAIRAQEYLSDFNERKKKP